MTMIITSVLWEEGITVGLYRDNWKDNGSYYITKK